MSYADAARTITTYIGSTDSPTIPLNSLLLARAGEALAPVSASQDGRSFGLGMKRLVSVADFYALARIPGVLFQQLTAEASVSFVVDCEDPPKILLSEFRSSDLGPLIGDGNIAVLKAMRGAWDQHIRGAGFWTNDQVERAIAIIDGGVLCFPVDARSLANRKPDLPAELLSPPLSGDADQARYAAVCAVFYDVLQQYQHKNMAEAAAAVDAANARADLWAAVQTAVEAVRDAPSNAVMGAGKLVGGAVWDTVLGNWPLVLLIAGGAALYLFRGKALAAVKSAAAKVGAQA